MLYVWKNMDGHKLRLKKINDELLKEIIYRGCYMNDFKYIRDLKYLTKKRINKLFKEAYKRGIYPKHCLLIMHQQSLANISFKYSYPKYKVTEDGTCIKK